MEKIEIYKFQMDVIKDALRLTCNIYGCRTGETSYARQVRQAEKYANNALEGNIDKPVPYI